jgi:hypothetical protein
LELDACDRKHLSSTLALPHLYNANSSHHVCETNPAPGADAASGMWITRIEPAMENSPIPFVSVLTNNSKSADTLLKHPRAAAAMASSTLVSARLVLLVPTFI